MSTYLEVEISEGNRKNGSLRFKKGETFFPADSWGGSNAAISGNSVKIIFHGTNEEKETDIDGKKRILRKTRGELRRFYSFHGVEAGDSVFVVKKDTCIFEIVPNLEQVLVNRDKESDDGASSNTKRKRCNVERIVRDTKVTLEVKEMYDYSCQICGLTINTSAGSYAEGAHIRPLGSPHDGPDTKSNILCLCPNHHVMLDRGVFTINEDFSLSGIKGSLDVCDSHNIDLDNIKYHRENYESA